MRAIRIDGQTPGGKRSRLANLVPLATPFSVQIFPIYACNLACNYCVHSLPLAERGFVSNEKILRFEMYKKAVDDMKNFPDRLKMLRIAGTGEPLLHPNISEMVAYAKEKDIADSIDIVTNGLKLSHELTMSLIKAGLDKIRISIQGLDDSAYSHINKKGIFDKLIDEVRFFYNNKKDTKIYIKIIDCALKKEEEEKFFNIFGDICDYIAIEHLIPAVDKIDYSSLANDQNNQYTQNGNIVKDVQICPQPFYMMQLNPDGNIVPCCSMETAAVLGNVANENIVDIWNGERYRIFLKNQLSFNKEIYPVCKKCQQYKYALFDEDILDNDANTIKERWVKK